MHHIMDKDLLAKMTLVEGKGLPKNMARAEEKGEDFTIATAKAQYKRSTAYGCDPDNSKTSAIPGTTIYGYWGMHRFYVTWEGEVVFSGFHASDESKGKAKDAGFRIY